MIMVEAPEVIPHSSLDRIILVVSNEAAMRVRFSSLAPEISKARIGEGENITEKTQ